MKGFWLGASIFLFALALRLFYLYESSENPTFEAPIVDSGEYCRLARSLVETGVMEDNFFRQPFFYPFFLSGVCFFSRSPIIWARLIQALLGSFTCLLTFKLGGKIFDRRVGVLAAILTALYGPLIFYEGELVAAGWAAFWSVSLILLFLNTAAEKSLRLCFFLGVGGALSFITRPAFLPFFLSGCIWLFVVFYRSPMRKRLLIPGFLSIIGGFLLIATPVALQSYRVTRRLGILPAEGGVNFYIGNNPDLCRTLTARPGLEWQRILDLPRGDGITGFWEKPRFFYEETVDYMLSQPFSFLEGLARKSMRFVCSREIPKSVDIYLFRRWSSFLGLLTWKVGWFGFPFGVFLPLALWGLIYYWKKVPTPLILFLLTYSLSLILIHVGGRYRAPMIPPMSILSAAGLLAVVEISRKRQWGRLAIVGGCMAMVVLLAGLPGPFCEEEVDHEAELYYCLGIRAANAGRTEEAISHYKTALRIRPGYASAHNNLGVILSREGSVEEAVNHYKAALRLEPTELSIYYNLGGVFESMGKVGDAIACYREVLRLNPESVSARNSLGLALASLGEFEEAIANFAEALRNKPDYPEAHVNLGIALVRRGKFEEALFHYSEALRLKPDFPEARRNREILLERMRGLRD